MLVVFKTNLYSYIARFVVQLKRLATGNFMQTKYTKYLESIEYLPLEELNSIQKENLCIMMTHVVNNIPFYKDLKDDLSLTPETAYEDIKKFPIVNKTIINSNPDAFIDKNTPYKYKMGTGGTSRVRIEVMRDKNSFTKRCDEYFDRMTGIYPGMCRLIFSITERDYRADSTEFMDYHSNKLTRTYHVKPKPLTDEKLQYMYKLYITKKPKIIKGNAYTVAMFAKYIEENNLRHFDIPIIRCYGLKLMPEYQAQIKRVFNTDIFDTYGATESNFVASQCKEHSGMHYSPSLHYLECIDDVGCEVESCTPGSLIVTSFSHLAMPIIRYEIGDYVSLSSDSCKCRRTLPKIEDVYGRGMEKIATENGSINIKEFDDILGEFLEIFDYQGIQTEKNKLVVTLVCKNDKLTDIEEESIRKNITDKIGNDISIELVYSNEIDMEENAKIVRLMPYKFYKTR